MRADLAVVERGWAPTRAKAQALLMAGIVIEGDQRVTKAGKEVKPERLRLKEELKTYVGRGALKLKSFFEAHPNCLVKGRSACDVGASTGGFTDYLLEQGVESVVCVDVGTNQLDWKLRSHPQVTSLEKTDIRSFEGGPFDLVVADLSFISLKKMVQYLTRLLKEKSDLIVLVKPQFEVGREHIAKGGIVKDEKAIDQVLVETRTFFEQSGVTFQALAPSAMKGAQGNQEYFMWFQR